MMGLVASCELAIFDQSLVAGTNLRGYNYYSLAVWRFKPILSAGLQFHTQLSGGLRLRNYRAVVRNRSED